MAIEYRKVDPAAVTDSVLKGRSLEREEAAFAAEMNAKRLESLAAALPAGPEKEALVEAHAASAAEAEKLRRKANRAKDAAAPTAEEVSEVHKAFLDRWVASIEQEHAAHTALKAERERVLALAGAGALDEDERSAIQAHLAENDAALTVLESAHAVAIAQLDALNTPVGKKGKK